jgi:hypothetical protein
MNVKLLALVLSSKWRLIGVLSTFFQLTNVKPTQFSSAQAGRQVISTALAAPQREL